MTVFPSFTRVSHTESYPTISPSRPELSSKGKVIVITGGGTGIGASITRAFAAGGSTQIAILSRTERNLLATKQSVEQEFPSTEVLTVAVDITNAKQLESAFETIHQSFGKLNVLVCNSGFLPTPHPVLSPDFDVQEWWTSFNTNVLGNLLTVREFVKYANKTAQILNISTCIAHIPPIIPGNSGYAASKLAAAKLFDYIASENPNLHVVNVHPGLVDTEMSRKSGNGGTDHSKFATLLRYHAAWVSGFKQSLSFPRSHHILVDLSGHFCLWLASPEAKFLRGKFVWVNWSADELIDRKKEISSTDVLDIKLGGVSFVGWDGSENLSGLRL